MLIGTLIGTLIERKTKASYRETLMIRPYFSLHRA